MLTFRTLSEQQRLFHTLSFAEQLVVIQNTALEAYGPGGTLLTVETVDWGEFWDVFRLLTPQFVGPFAATFLEGTYAAYRYLPSNTNPDMMEVFERAIKGEYWQKYVGLLQYDWTYGSHNMGSIVHALNLLGEAYFDQPSDEEMGATMSPGGVLPAYAKHIIPEAGNALVIGAFSVKSIQDIWMLWQQVLGSQTQVQVIDTKGTLTPLAAAHYGLAFSHMDGVCTTYEDDSFALVLANYLLVEICCTNGSSPAEALTPLFCELSRILTRGGRAVLVDRVNEGSDEHLLCCREISELANNVGLTAHVEPTEFVSRVAVERLINDDGGSVVAASEVSASVARVIVLVK